MPAVPSRPSKRKVPYHESVDSTNHRVHWIEVTARGRELHDRITDGLKRAYARRLQPFGGSFVRRVAGLLDQLADLARR
jgi:hypothetical protein